mmetsp:Transcript_3207/g.7808  ORF Transcript_3207/g.7808 Transcript_3207/m.7808 type:complete len:465 (-) Transcript_3207:96-1490(-)|eukprot:CAMPEP_0182916108 /NCGR_PEP_ID=MMETSP0105_2-20130417/748_1 /TAXON_ID=81532 ORGANISM="Acanthoeca-like sp., Strain 10tr" /NCGR_SAMPLE_ID=MMETSP0105_2 /ASSEMBLY_ACC=CAM_ASM_000205 /LENGTH=464 /DNA_ID=CAMNT_0025053037 /DNA_START=46 /DNA_END=1440 /DNA_ORIENTATION=+
MDAIGGIMDWTRAAFDDMLAPGGAVNEFLAYTSVSELMDTAMVMFTAGSLLILFAPKFRQPWLYMSLMTVLWVVILAALVTWFVMPNSRDYTQIGGSSLLFWIFFSFFDGKGIKIAFIICLVVVAMIAAWWNGPPTNIRTLVLVEGVITVIGTALVAFSTPGCSSFLDWQCRMPKLLWAALLIVVNKTLGVDVMIRFVRMRIRWLWYAVYRPRRQYMSEEEYVRHGIEKTKEGLARLQTEYSGRSDTRSMLEVLSRVNDPKSLIDFFLSGEHVPADQVADYENHFEFSSLLRKNFVNVAEDTLYEDDLVDDSPTTDSQYSSHRPSRYSNRGGERTRVSPQPAAPANGGGGFMGSFFGGSPAPSAPPQPSAPPAASAPRRSTAAPRTTTPGTTRRRNIGASAPEQRAGSASHGRTSGAVWKRSELEHLSAQELALIHASVGNRPKPVLPTTMGIIIKDIVGKPKA